MKWLNIEETFTSRKRVSMPQRAWYIFKGIGRSNPSSSANDVSNIIRSFFWLFLLVLVFYSVQHNERGVVLAVLFGKGYADNAVFLRLLGKLLQLFPHVFPSVCMRITASMPRFCSAAERFIREAFSYLNAVIAHPCHKRGNHR